MKLPRRRFLHLAAGAAALPAVSRIARAQAYPSRPVTIVVPLVAGGPVDAVARILAEHMRNGLGKPVVIENIGGGSGTIGTGRVARAPPDGYMVVLGGSAPHVFNGAIYALPYDLVKDFEPVILLPSSTYWFVASKSLPANNLNEFIAWLKANPDKAAAGTVGISGQICGTLFQNQTGVRFHYIPYRGGPPLLQDLLAGRIDFACELASNSLPQVRGGNLKALAVASPRRWSIAPEVPTVDEAGAPGLYFSAWLGLWAPKGTPKPIIDKLNTATAAAMAEPTVRRRIADLGVEIPAREQQTPEALGAFQKAEIEKWWPIIKAAGIKAE